VKDIITEGGEATAFIGDVSQEDKAQARIEAAIDHYGKLDVLINNAGILTLGAQIASRSRLLLLRLSLAIKLFNFDFVALWNYEECW
jgi:NAD(P)-dependent dehydrogenase (short-subunit alcohol dehydrogenase family)